MIRVIGANPAMDRVSTWPPLRLDAVNRATTVTVVPGGKGFNVARACARLGEDVAAYGFLGGHVGEALREMIVADGIIDRHTTIADGTRVSFIVVEPETGRSTVLNEPGPMVTADETEQLVARVREDVASADVVVLSGSLPDSVGPELAGTLVSLGVQAGARTAVDIHGASLRAAADARPWMLKCNRRELRELLGAVDPDGPVTNNELAVQMQRLRDSGIELVVVTLGPDGALLADGDGVVHALPPAIDEVNPTGSGDLLLAGLVAGLERGQPSADALALGIACGTAGATTLLPELPPDFDAADWLSRITLSRLDVPT